MPFASDFIPIELADLHREAAIKKADGWRFMQTHAVYADGGVDLYYSFMKGGAVENLCVRGIQKDQPVPSITDLFLAAFVFENEARELFGVDMRDIAIDFAGAMYAPAESEPMTFISPEQKAARDKALKAAAAKAAKEGSAQDAPASAPASGGFVMTPERRARLDAKLAVMSPEKVAKVEAALKARAAEGAQAAGAPAGGDAGKGGSAKQEAPKAEAPAKEAKPAADPDLEAKLAAMDPDKAAKVRAAMQGKAAAGGRAPAAEAEPADPEQPQAPRQPDGQLEQLIGLMDDAKAQVVRNALNAKEGE